MHSSIFSSGDRRGLIVVSSNSLRAGGSESDVIDGTINGVGLIVPSMTTTESWLKFDFGKNVVCLGARLYINDYGFGRWKWQGSFDDVTWADLTKSFYLQRDVGKEFFTTVFTQNRSDYKYYRIVKTDNIGGANDYWIEMEFDIEPKNEKIIIREIPFYTNKNSKDITHHRTIGEDPAFTKIKAS